MSLRIGEAGRVAMSMVMEGDLLWAPTPERVARANLTHYLQWLAARGRHFDGYGALWQWSIEDLEGFWGSLWEYFGIRASHPYACVLAKRRMPGAEWFPGARLNYAEHALRHERDGADALLFLDERHSLRSLSWRELGDQVRRLATRLRAFGLEPGDCVAAYLTNSPEALIAMLATVSIGAIWSCCGPDFGARGVVDRFQQLAPKLMFAVDGYCYGGKRFDRRTALRAILAELPSVEHVIYLRRLDPADAGTPHANTTLWEQALAGASVPRESFVHEQVAFAHPLWILFSSGTTGLPKPIVHSHGGITLEQFKNLALHMDLHGRERMFFYTTTGWMMWNFIASCTHGGRRADTLRWQSHASSARFSVADGPRHRCEFLRSQSDLYRGPRKRAVSCPGSAMTSAH